MPVKVSHNLDLGPDLPNEVMDIARKQGENPERVCADIQELRDMIFGKKISINSIASFDIVSIVLCVQNEEFACHPALTTNSSSVSCAADTSNWNIHTIW